MAAFQKITPCLWFDSKAEEAARFYVSVFKNARIGGISRYGDEGFEIHGRSEGSVMTVEFEIEGQPFTALNGGPQFKFNEAISFQIPCETPGRDRPLLGQTLRRRRNPAVRLDQGQVRRLMANIPGGLAGDAARFRQGESGAGDARHARHEETRYCRIAGGL
jgi:hypothetical protein